MELIFAEATPPGRGGVSVIRLSGEGARQAAEALVGELPVARMAYFRNLADRGEIIDQVLALRFEPTADADEPQPGLASDPRAPEAPGEPTYWPVSRMWEK